MKQIRSQKAMVTGIVALYLSPLASTRKGHRIRDVLKFNSATRIRTWKMLESESSALPFGDSALNNMFMIIQDCPNVKHFFEKYIKFCFLFPKGNDIIKRSCFMLWMEERICIHLPAGFVSVRRTKMESCHSQAL